LIEVTVLSLSLLYNRYTEYTGYKKDVIRIRIELGNGESFHLD